MPLGTYTIFSRVIPITARARVHRSVFRAARAARYFPSAALIAEIPPL